MTESLKIIRNWLHFHFNHHQIDSTKNYPVIFVFHGRQDDHLGLLKP